ncbi:MAG TPA: nuclease-related domain-containing protein, partial [Ottowia sp.]|nr:nuclease-related domain-containing protein [Ottowia sp.]
MALLHPSAPLGPATTRGLQREHDVLRLLESGLPDGFDVFHSVDWSCVFDGRQLHGEIDVAVVAPNGHIVLLEIKAGPVIESDTALGKQYGTGPVARTKDVGHQVRRLYASLRTRLHDAGLGHTIVTTMLVLPDHKVLSSVLAFPGDRVVDA